MVKPRPIEARDPVEVVRDYLARGLTGCLVVEDQRGAWRIYVMQGELIAAHGPRDGEAIVRRLLRGEAISSRQADALAQELAQGNSIETALLGRVPEDLFLELLVQRFRQNVLDFLSCTATPRFEPMEAVFVENIQTGHDSMQLLDGVAVIRDRIRDLRARSGRLLVRVGRGAPRQQSHARLLDIADPQRPLDAVLEISPFEEGATLLAMTEMREQGVVELLDEQDLAAEEAGRLASAEPELLVEDDEDEEDSLIPEAAGPTEQDEETQEVPASGDVDQFADLASDLIEPISEAAGAVGGSFLDLHEDLIQDDEPAPVHPTIEPAPEEPEDPNVLLAIERAREEEQRRATARGQLDRDEAGVTTRPPGFDWEVELPHEELSFFEDQDEVRGLGQGHFVAGQSTLDVVDLSAEGMAALQRAFDLPVEAGATEPDLLEMAEASEEEARHAVALNFSGPQLDENDILRKIEVVNDVLATVVRAIDEQSGRGSGKVGMQLLVDGTPTNFAVLFRGVKVDDDGRMDAEKLLKNLRKRPQSEHRRLVNDGLMDMVQRCLSMSLEELSEAQVDQLLESIAGYQQRLGL